MQYRRSDATAPIFHPTLPNFGNDLPKPSGIGAFLIFAILVNADPGKIFLTQAEPANSSTVARAQLEAMVKTVTKPKSDPQNTHTHVGYTVYIHIYCIYMQHAVHMIYIYIYVRMYALYTICEG